MTIDATTLSIVSAVGTTGVAVGGGLWAYIKSLHLSTVKELKAHNMKLDKRTEDCEEDRRKLHGRLNEQSERITDISRHLGRLQGFVERDKDKK